MPDHSLTERLAQHLLRAVDGPMRGRARLHLLDWMGCVAGARHGPVAAVMRRSDHPATLRAAMLGNVLEMDDVHRAAILHPGPVIWPAVLGRSGQGMAAMLDAAVRGYEATIAIGATFDAAHYGYWHNTTTAGLFGSAAAVSSLLGADATILTSALGLAGSVSGGFWQMRHEPVMAKQWHIAHAVRTGAAAAQDAAIGMTGPRFVLEGAQGVYAATCHAPKPLQLAAGWRMAEVSFKPWGACRHAHPAIDAALALRARGTLTLPVTVETFADALAFCDSPHPATPHQAKFSIQHAVAVVMMRGEPTLEDFEAESIAALADARAGVLVRENPAITARYPDHFGATVIAETDRESVVDTLGDPERPLSRDGVIAKARALFAWGELSDAQAQRGLTLALDGDDADGVVSWLDEIL
ncbi:MmgE/PrpD family protein [Sphingomonas sp. 28-63-12]|uniref:MmgE/PrpD family protein n=1 Tax=Sphingomonas sp. 28-63-12 TaxID=1970434 RepID=UPI0035A8E49F